MKAILMITVLFASLLAQAAQSENWIYQCLSTSGTMTDKQEENAAPQPLKETLSVTVGEGRSSAQLGAPPEYVSFSYPVDIRYAGGDKIAFFDGSGKVSAAAADLTLIVGGDMAMGTLKINHTVSGIVGQTSFYSNGYQVEAQLTCTAAR